MCVGEGEVNTPNSLQSPALTYKPILAELEGFGRVETGTGDKVEAPVHCIMHSNDADISAEWEAQDGTTLQNE